MCENCWHEYGAPRIDNQRVRAAAEAIRRVYDEPNGVTGGGMHVQLDDWNLDFFDDESRTMIEKYGEPDERPVQYACFDLMRTLTEEERASALALHDGFWVHGIGEP